MDEIRGGTGMVRIMESGCGERLRSGEEFEGLIYEMMGEV